MLFGYHDSIKKEIAFQQKLMTLEEHIQKPKFIIMVEDNPFYTGFLSFATLESVSTSLQSSYLLELFYLSFISLEYTPPI